MALSYIDICLIYAFNFFLVGATIPHDTTYFRASSTLISSFITSDFGIKIKKPEVGFGVVGMNMLNSSSSIGVLSCSSLADVPAYLYIRIYPNR